MAFRDDQQAMKLRIEQLEGELAVANETIARLRGEADERVSDGMAGVLTKERFHHVRSLDVEVTDTGLEAIAAMWRQRLPAGQVSMVGRTLHCTWGQSTLELRRERGRTEVRVDSFMPLVRMLRVLIGMGFALLGGPLVAGMGVGLLGLVGVTPPGWLGAAFAPVALVLGYLAAGKLHERTVRLHRMALCGALEAALSLAEEHAEPSPQRIAIDAEGETASDEAAFDEAAVDEAAVDDAAGAARRS